VQYIEGILSRIYDLGVQNGNSSYTDLRGRQKLIYVSNATAHV